MADLKYKIVLGDGREYEIDLKKELEIEETSLNTILSKQPGQFAWIGVLHSLSAARVERLKNKLEYHEYSLDLKIRNQSDKGGKGGKLTENKIKAMIKTDSKRMSLVKRLISAKEQTEWLQAARDAFGHRKDCLISLGANRRAEGDVKTSIKDK